MTYRLLTDQELGRFRNDCARGLPKPNPDGAFDSAITGQLTGESLDTVMQILNEAALAPDVLEKLTDLFRTHSALSMDGMAHDARPTRHGVGDDDRAAWKAHASRIGQCW